MSRPAAPQILTQVYDFLVYLLPQVAKFPKSERYLLGERLEQASFDILEWLLAAAYSAEKLSLLRRTNIRLEHVRHYLRLCKDLHLINLHRYEVASKHVHEIGLQLGGWIKHQQSRP